MNQMQGHSPLFRKYAVILAMLVSAAVLASGVIQAYFAYQQTQEDLIQIQQEKAAAAAVEIERFVRDIEQQLSWANPPVRGAGEASLEQRRVDFLRLLRQALAVTEASYLDASGEERLRISRLAMSAMGSAVDRSQEPAFRMAKSGKTYNGPVYFRNGSEPYMTIAIAESSPGTGVTIAEVNLKLILEVIEGMRVGQAGQAYVVDSSGVLLAHRDISRVLQRTDVSAVPQIRNALSAPYRHDGATAGSVATSLQGYQVLTTYQPIDPPGWLVFVEQPLEEAYAPLYASVARTLALLIAGLFLSMLASIALARRMVTPIRTVQAGAARIGEGALDERIEVRTGDELQTLAEEFNQMAARLSESYAGLEGKVQDRTHELARALDEQTATAEILKSVTQSGFNVRPVLESILDNAMRLCTADEGFMFRLEGDVYALAIAHDAPPEVATYIAAHPVAPGRGTVVGRVALECAPVHIHDVLTDPEYESAEVQQIAGYRTVLGVPILRDGTVVGVIGLGRHEVRPFTEREIQLVTTFADEALIAIESVRLFQEIEEKSRQLEIASQHKSQFLANMSHELRTPLNAIIGFSEVLLARMFGELNVKQAEYLNDILGSGRHLLGLLNDILDLSKIEADRMELEVSVFSLPDVLQNGLTMVREQATVRGISLALDVDPHIGFIQADERRVKQVAFNLLSNAVKFTPAGGRIDVTAQMADGEVYVAVRDTGIGIAKEDQERIFEEFQQAGSRAGNRNEGTGLGLTVVKRLVELHGGRIWVESQPGVGSIFTFSLPLRQRTPQAVPAEEADYQATGPQAVGASGSGPTVLVIEDDPRSADLLWLYLTGAGFDVVVAHDGQEGLDLARSLRPVAITLDIMLPGIDGWDFLAQTKSDPALADIPVVIVSMLEEQGRGYALGAAEYIVKPVSRDALLAALRRVTVQGQPAGLVLVIDDDPMAIGLVEAVLVPQGYRVLAATSGDEGIAIAQRERPGLIILDLLMPGLDGFMVLEELRAHVATQAIPTVILTAKTLTPEEKQRLNGQISDLARKSDFDMATFVELVRRYCRAPVA